MSKTPQSVLLIKWPDSQRIMEHPNARAIEDDDYPNSYIVSAEIWEMYKNSYYKNPKNLSAEADSLEEQHERDDSDNEEVCTECGNNYSMDHICYCTYCNQAICDKCYII